ncbi:MAG: polyphosphate kinase 2 family protein [Nitrospirae bacterium]|jgi:PPK2 family polyphosphate:nucleotide phosphotransferase|nr:polyphosphate kinase 2 family protein [Nitrospirota bacterium]
MTEGSAETSVGLKYRVKPGSKFRLEDISADCPDLFKGKEGKEKAERHIVDNLEQIGSLQNVLYASRKAALLVVLQGIDAAGKDGVIKHVLSGVNPQGCFVRSFKVPTEEERLHDVLWRVHRHTPERGVIGIFNRSHYEEVLVARVHKLKPKSIWQKHYEQFNAFEKMLSDNGTVILKFFLRVTQEEQLRRIEERLTRPDKKWKYSPSDLVEREYWDDYQRAYEDMLNKCSTEYAPWFVIPSDKKWFRNYLVSAILLDTLKGLDLKYPDAKQELANQGH